MECRNSVDYYQKLSSSVSILGDAVRKSLMKLELRDLSTLRYLKIEGYHCDELADLGTPAMIEGEPISQRGTFIQ